MSLQRSTLIDNFKEIVDYRTGPKTFQDAVRVWAEAYDDYAKNATAHVLVPKLAKELITTSMVSSPQDFYGGLSVGIVAYWTASVWSGPGFVGSLPTAVNPRNLFVTLSADMMKGEISVESAADKISAVLHEYTSSLLVIATNVNSGATTTVKIS